MKNYILILFTLLTFGSFSQVTARPQCCPHYVEITITGTNLDSLHIDSVLAITPTANGKGIRLTNPPVIKSYHDGTPLIFASGEFVKIINEYGDVSGYDGGEMSAFSDQLITPTEGIGQGFFYQSYYIPYQIQITPSLPFTCTGKVYIWSTFPITGGGANAKLVVCIWYEEITY